MAFSLFSAAEQRKLGAEAAFSKLYRSDSGRFWVNQVTRDHSADLISEMHDTEADIYLVVEGEADLYLGGTIVEQTTPEPGQHVGTGLDGAECRHIGQGDMVVIPEGVPHMLDVRNSRIVYLVVKENVG
jgi:mannose-6-phosphate isomerase-like protein (cupin superfamily)